MSRENSNILRSTDATTANTGSVKSGKTSDNGGVAGRSISYRTELMRWNNPRYGYSQENHSVGDFAVAATGSLIGEIFRLLDVPARITRNGKIGNLDTVGGLIGYTDLLAETDNRFAPWGYNSVNKFVSEKITGDTIFEKQGELYDANLQAKSSLAEFGESVKKTGLYKTTWEEVPDVVYNGGNNYSYASPYFYHAQNAASVYGENWEGNTGSVYKSSLNSTNLFTNLGNNQESSPSDTILSYDENNGGGSYSTSDYLSDLVSTDSLPSYHVHENVSIGSPIYSDANSSPLIKKTNELFSQGKIKSLISSFHTEDVYEDDELVSSKHSGYGMSRGRNLLKKEKTTEYGYENPYCRVWTQRYQYAKLSDRIRPFYNEEGGAMSIKDTQANYEALRPNNGADRLDGYSTLMKNGFVRITPTYGDNENSNSTTSLTYSNDVKKCMFSIENLAWRDVNIEKNLTKEQRGPNGGRIMWFPPYGLSFNENTNAQWESNTFIGRGEPIYTYSNTERDGNISFIILVDHPSIMNKWRGRGEANAKYEAEQTLLRFFAGCDNLSDGMLTGNTTTKKTTVQKQSEDAAPSGKTIEVAYVMFFPNDYSAVDCNNAESVIENIKKYEYDDTEWGNTRDKSFEREKLQTQNEDNINSGMKLNKDITANKDKIVEILYELEDNGDNLYSFDDMLNCKGLESIIGKGTDKTNSYEINSVSVQGFASSHGYQKNNEILCTRRASAIASILKSKLNISDDIIIRDGDNNHSAVENRIIQIGDDENKQINRDTAKIARAAIATVSVTINDDEQPSNEGSAETYIELKETPVMYDTTKSDDEIEEAIRATGLYTNLLPTKEGGLSGGTINPAIKTAYTGTTTTTANTASVSKVLEEPATEDYSYDNEYLYFKNLKDTDYNYYKNLIDKIQYFSPAFHSITPEGFNARLTFLQQCLRQGPTGTVGSTNSSVPAGNLAFGRAPYCVLRIGDFFHTKIIINSMSITYESGDNIQYDLNPEGIGVQPMMAKVQLNVKFLGGQDIAAPVNRLQNAVSYNYYANASIYDRHADYYKKPESNENIGELITYDAMNPGEN